MNSFHRIKKSVVNRPTSCVFTQQKFFSDKKLRPRAVKLSYKIYDDGDEARTYKNTTVFPIIVIPGMFGTKTNWNSLSKTISGRCGRQLISVDVRNHGSSEWSAEFDYDCISDDILTLLDELNIKQANFIGHSMGGRTAMRIALREPRYVEKLLIVDVSPIKMSPESEQLLRFVKAMKKIKFPEGTKLLAARKQAFHDLYYVTENVAIRRFLIMNLQEKQDKSVGWSLNLDAIEKGLPNILKFNAAGLVFNGPTVFIGGEHSQYLSRNQEPDILKIFPAANFHYIPFAGHWLHVQKPREFLTIVCPFLKSPES